MPSEPGERPPRLNDEDLLAALETLSVAALLPAEAPIPSGSIPAYLEAGAAIVPANLKVLRTLEQLAQRRLAAGRHEDVLSIARAAGDWACSHHPGLYSSTVMEQVLTQLGRDRAGLLHSQSPEPAPPLEDVLHVLTQANSIGGHTRLAARWMQADTGHRHSVVLTEQGEGEIPAFLLEQTGGRAYQLGAPTPAGRVTELMIRIEAAQMVVLHIHPYDAVAVAACASPAAPPTVFVDHGDHVFWLGASVSDALASLRPSGGRVATARRGIAPDRLRPLPIPLTQVSRAQERTVAKAALGIDASAVVLLTLASAAKFAPMGTDTFTRLAGELLSRHPAAHLVAVGPDPKAEDWSRLSGAFPSRVTVVQPTPETDGYYEAADIYLDSFPFASLTSMFEAASFQTPVVSLFREEAGPMSSDDHFVDISPARGVDAWLKLAGALIVDSDLRATQGATLAHDLLSTHGLAQVDVAVQSLYECARLRDRNIEPAAQTSQLTAPDAYLAGYHLAANLGRPADVLLKSYGLLPAFL